MNILKVVFMTVFSCFTLTIFCQSKDSLEVVRATEKFLTSFNNFDWITFRKFFAKDATIFFPELQYGRRVAGEKDVENIWLEIFPEFKDPANKFKMNIIPEDLFVQLYNTTAIVTFQMGKSDSFLSRRTFIFIKEKKDWKIAHLHASNVSAN